MKRLTPALTICSPISTAPIGRRGQDANSVALKVSRAGDASQDRIAVSLEKRPTGGKGRASASTASP